MSSSYERLFKRTTAGIKPGLEVITALLEALGNPHHQLAVIHVAGTNGKGSVCAMLESVLRETGFKTGLYTSPHLIDFSERFRVSGEQITAEKLDGYIARMEQVADAVEESSGLRGATFFEISTAIAFQYFADEGVDIAIVETGMGGRWDATNVVIPLLSVVTHIDIDHTHFLGDTLEEIAGEKAGIIKPGRPVVSAPQADAAMRALKKEGQPIILSSEAVSVQKIGKPQKVKIETHSRSLPPVNLALMGACQRENCAVAMAALEVLGDLLGIEPEFKAGLESVEWSARFQLICSEPVVILDGAHNPSAGKALAGTLKEAYPKHEFGFVFGFLDDKEVVGFLRELKPLVRKAWTVGINAPRGNSAEASSLQCDVAGISADPVGVAEVLAVARGWAVGGVDRVLVLTGSLYLKQALGV